MKSALLCARNAQLRSELQDGLARKGYEVLLAETPDDALKALKQGASDALITEIRRDAFAYLLQGVHSLHPAMPVHLIDGQQVFCFYPLARQPADLIEAITGAGVAISSHLLRHATMMDASPTQPQQFLI